MHDLARLNEAVTATNEALIKMSQQLRSRVESTEVRRGIDFRRYRNGSKIEFYVDAELKNKKGLCWWLEVQWTKEKWIIESSVLLNDKDGQHTIREFPMRVAKSLDEIITELEEATAALVGSIDCFDMFCQ